MKLPEAAKAAVWQAKKAGEKKPHHLMRLSKPGV
jgi:hypothetical protein